jgi:hypothetical protein
VPAANVMIDAFPFKCCDLMFFLLSDNYQNSVAYSPTIDENMAKYQYIENVSYVVVFQLASMRQLSLQIQFFVVVAGISAVYPPFTRVTQFFL